MDNIQKLCKILKDHLNDEVKIHNALLNRKRTLKQHCSDTIKIHKKAIKEIEALSKKH